MSDPSPLDQSSGAFVPHERVRFQDLEDLSANNDDSQPPTHTEPAADPFAMPLPDPAPAADTPSSGLSVLGNPAPALPSSATAQPIPARKRVRIMIGLVFLIILVAINLAIGSGKLLIEKVISESMEPTLLVGDRLLCDVNAVPRRYSIVVLKDPEDVEGKLVKRIIGLPGDRIQLRDGLLYVNGVQEVSDKVSANVINWNDINVKVPDDKIFVMGDNRNNSFDSLNFGPVPFDDVLGVVTAIVWPRGRWGRIQPFKPDAESED